MYQNSLWESRPLHCSLNRQNSHARFIGELESSAEVSTLSLTRYREMILWQQVGTECQRDGGYGCMCNPSSILGSSYQIPCIIIGFLLNVPL